MLLRKNQAPRCRRERSGNITVSRGMVMRKLRKGKEINHPYSKLWRLRLKKKRGTKKKPNPVFKQHPGRNIRGGKTSKQTDTR